MSSEPELTDLDMTLGDAHVRKGLWVLSREENNGDHRLRYSSQTLYSQQFAVNYEFLTRKFVKYARIPLGSPCTQQE